jgi:hypothetical protein
LSKKVIEDRKEKGTEKEQKKQGKNRERTEKAGKE